MPLGELLDLFTAQTVLTGRGELEKTQDEADDEFFDLLEVE